MIQDKRPELTPGVYWLQTPPPPMQGDPANTFYLVLRVYAPTPQVSATQTWSPPAIVPVR